ncbi:MAG: cytochrome c biogenesis protein CcdA [Eubacteriales bacterium]
MLNNISFVFVFIEGVLSFFSPCVIPLIPVYISYLAGSQGIVTNNNPIYYERKKVLMHTICFVLGISTAFFILGMSFTAIGTFFQSNKLWFTRIGGIIIVVLGLFQIGFLEFKFLKKEKKLHLDLNKIKVNPFVAYAMGFTFSFAWTPCIGPMLSSVLILASSANSTLMGNILVLIYTIGFTLPFLLLGLFTTQVLTFLNKHQKLLKYTVKTGGIILIIIGVMTFTGWMNGFSAYLNSFDPSIISEDNQKEDEIVVTEDNASEDSDTNDASESDDNTNKKSAIDFDLVDQYGNEHKLSNYKGKVVFLNFWATWCPPCRQEMPHIQEIYNENNQNQDDVIILGIANPKSDAHPLNQDVEKQDIIAFLHENKYDFPVVFDVTGEIFKQYQITAFPTTFMIDKEGNIAGYTPGMLSKDMMRNIIQQTINASN